MQWEYLGYSAGLISMFGFVPQIRQMYKTKSASDVSLVMLVQNSLGTLLWLLYGIHLQDTPMIMANTVAFSTYFVGTVLYFKYRKVT